MAYTINNFRATSLLALFFFFSNLWICCALNLKLHTLNYTIKKFRAIFSCSVLDQPSPFWPFLSPQYSNVSVWAASTGETGWANSSAFPLPWNKIMQKCQFLSNLQGNIIFYLGKELWTPGEEGSSIFCNFHLIKKFKKWY